MTGREAAGDPPRPGGGTAPHGAESAEAGDERVRRALQEAGVAWEARFPVRARTARQAAASVGAPVGAIVKSLVFQVGGTPVLVLTSGAHRVDGVALGRYLGGEAAPADPEAVREATGFPVGAVPPLGHRQPLPAYADPALLEHPRVWASLGRADALFAAEPHALLRAAGAALLPPEVFAPDPAAGP